jgi:hypothetical protein
MKKQEVRILLDPLFPEFSEIETFFKKGLKLKSQGKRICLKFIVSRYSPERENELEGKFDLFLLNTEGSSWSSKGYDIKLLKEKFGKEKSIFILDQCCEECDKTIGEVDNQTIYPNLFVGFEIVINIRNALIRMFS